MKTLVTFSLFLSSIGSAASVEAIHQQVTETIETGHYMEAVSLCREMLKQYDPSSMQTALLLRDLSRAYRGAGRLKQAEASRMQELEIVKARLGEDDANVALAFDGLG